MSGLLSIVRVSSQVKYSCADGIISGGLLQSYQPAVWIYHRVLLTAIVPRDESNGRVSHNTIVYCSLSNTYRFEYLWQDAENFKRPTKMPAPTYIEHLMAWVQSNIDNESVFPSRIGTVVFHIVHYLCTNINRRPIPQVLPEHDSASVQADVPRLRPHLLPPLSCHPRTRA